MRLREFYLRPDAVLIPVEHLSPAGMTPALADLLRSERGLSAEWVALFNASFATAYARVDDLFSRSPGSWFPPRLQNVCLLTSSERAHPYTRPLSKSAWLLYADDFDPQRSNVELGAYLLVQAERLNVTGELSATVTQNLSYWLTRTTAEIAEFKVACQRSSRPDQPALNALAEALDWIGELHHRDLRPLVGEPSEPTGELEGTGLLVPASFQERIASLAQATQAAATSAVRAYYARQPGEGAKGGGALLDWLSSDAPPLLITGEGDRVLWDPERPGELDALREALGEVAPAPAQSVLEDLQVVGSRTRTFLDSLRDPKSLALPSAEIDQSGGTYIHAGRGLIAFDLLQQPAWVPLREVTPPFQRLLLAARVLHEWGHVSDESGLIRVVPEQQVACQEARAELGESFARVIASFPEPLVQLTARELDGATGLAAGREAAKRALHRLPDQLANNIARRFLALEEMEAYVRINVRTHREERLTPLRLLINYAVEYQYLLLSQVEDPFAYFLDLSAFERLFVANGVMTKDSLKEIFDATERVCACHAPDPERFVELPA